MPDFDDDEDDDEVYCSGCGNRLYDCECDDELDEEDDDE